ncbi:MAG: RNA polymerase sigma factor [Thermoanaerobaculia bacterium]
MDGQPDPGLLGRFVEGDPEAFEALFRQFQAETGRWILRIVRDASASEDVLVETFWRAHRARARYDPARSFGAWLRRIATNAALDHLARLRRQPETSPVPPEELASEATDRDLIPAITKAFSTLSPRLQVVATLVLVEQLPLAEVAVALGLPVGTVKSRLCRASALLRERLLRMGIRP